MLLGQTVFGKNLIVNGDAESGPGDPDGYTPVSTIPGWQISGAPDVLRYASGSEIGVHNVRPLASGNNYFYGGNPAANSRLTQTIDLSPGAVTIDAGTTTFTASAYLGGWEQEAENAQMTVTFLDNASRPLTSVTLGPVTPDDRQMTIGLWYRRAVGRVPIGTRSAAVVLAMNWASANHNDAAADDLSLVLNMPSPPESLLDTNLIVNGNAETLGVDDASQIVGDAVDVPGWNRTGLFTIDSYSDAAADLDGMSPGPTDRGNFYFYGGNGNQLSSAMQDIDVSSASSLVDTGTATYQLSAWLGGITTQRDNADLKVEFRDWSGTVLASATLGPASVDDRGGVSSLLSYTQSSGVPSGTRVIRVILTMTRFDGGDNDGLADNLSLVLSAPGGNSLPSIAPGSIVSASAFGGFSSAAPGSWIEIYGSGLAPDVRGWSGSDFNNSTAPTSLDGVKVLVGGEAAFVDYVSPNQVNALIPSDLPPGRQTLVVSNAKGSSAGYTLTLNATQPGLLAPASFNVGGRQYVLALLPDGTFVLPAGAIDGVNSRPAHPGETVTMYGVGFGRVSPDIPAGQLVEQANDLVLPLSMRFGTTSAFLAYKGLAPNFTGLYQFNVVIPNVGDSDATALSFTLGSTDSAQTLYTAVHQ